MRVLELQIEDVAFGGKGVGRYRGKAVFVPYTIEGERARARIVREKKHFAEAELVQVVARSEHRVEPRCPYFGRCGGCAYQHVDYPHQLEIKTHQVEQTLRRIARLPAVAMRAIVPSPATYEYRNRITVHAAEGVVGFFQRDSNRLIDVEFCPISRPEVNEKLRALRGGRVRDGHYTLRVDEGARVFSQTNDAVGEELARAVSEMVPHHQSLLIDAYCGSGFFAKRLLDRARRVAGVDWDRFAIAAAQKSATSTETYIAGEIDAHLRDLLSSAAQLNTTAVIVDPPAEGLSPAVRAALIEYPAGTLIYVSCNPATLARDLRELQRAFSVESITPLDMFPQTAEIEVAVHLRALEKNLPPREAPAESAGLNG